MGDGLKKKNKKKGGACSRSSSAMQPSTSHCRRPARYMGTLRLGSLRRVDGPALCFPTISILGAAARPVGHCEPRLWPHPSDRRAIKYPRPAGMNQGSPLLACPIVARLRYPGIPYMSHALYPVRYRPGETETRRGMAAGNCPGCTPIFGLTCSNQTGLF